MLSKIFHSIFYRGGHNLVCPLALLSEEPPTNTICQNLIRAIRHLTGTSIQDLLEIERLVQNEYFDEVKKSRVKELEEKFLSLDPVELGEAEALVRSHQLENLEPMKKLKQTLLSDQKLVLKFKLVDELPEDDVIDYVLVHGNDVSDLTAQTMVSVSKSMSEKTRTIEKLFNVLAEFCHLSSASDLRHTAFFSGEN